MLAAQILGKSVSTGTKVLDNSGHLDHSIGLIFRNTDVFNKSDAGESIRNFKRSLKIVRNNYDIQRKGADITGLFKFINGWKL